MNIHNYEMYKKKKEIQEKRSGMRMLRQLKNTSLFEQLSFENFTL